MLVSGIGTDRKVEGGLHTGLLIERDRPIASAGIQLGEDCGSHKLIGNLIQGPSVVVGSLDGSV